MIQIASRSRNLCRRGGGGNPPKKETYGEKSPLHGEKGFYKETKAPPPLIENKVSIRNRPPPPTWKKSPLIRRKQSPYVGKSFLCGRALTFAPPPLSLFDAHASPPSSFILYFDPDLSCPCTSKLHVGWNQLPVFLIITGSIPDVWLFVNELFSWSRLTDHTRALFDNVIDIDPLYMYTLYRLDD